MGSTRATRWLAVLLVSPLASLGSAPALPGARRIKSFGKNSRWARIAPAPPSSSSSPFGSLKTREEGVRRRLRQLHAVDPGSSTDVVCAYGSGVDPGEVVSAVAAVAGAIDYGEILRKASNRAVGGGTSVGTSDPLSFAFSFFLFLHREELVIDGLSVQGALAGITQVLSLMWLRTTMNYQYRYGTDTMTALRELYSQGGVPRLYQGLSFALVQNPLSRFGDTAANAGVLAVLEALPETRELPLAVKQGMASLAASSWRIVITPVDTLKTTLQVDGQEALSQLKNKVSLGGPGVLWNGAFAAAAATFVGNYPWFLTYNYVDGVLPRPEEGDVAMMLARRALLGIAASAVSDTISNSLRVVKTAKQTSKVPISYVEAAKEIVETDGPLGLLGRGLQTRLLVNCLQGALFAVAWKYFEKKLGVS